MKENLDHINTAMEAFAVNSIGITPDIFAKSKDVQINEILDSLQMVHVFNFIDENFEVDLLSETVDLPTVLTFNSICKLTFEVQHLKQNDIVL